MTPEYIVPGAIVKLRDGSKARIYATDGGGDFPIQGAILLDGWRIHLWDARGHYYIGEPSHDRTIIGPWIDEPDASKLWPLLPPWIHWLAMDSDGEWYGYTCSPDFEDDGVWTPASAIVCGVPSGYAPTFTGDWTKSLIRRPKS